MSVPEPQRDTAPTQFLDSAYDLADYTFRKCKKFPKRWGHEIKDKIEETALDILTNAKRANSVWVKTAKDAELRRRYFMMAYASAQGLVSQVELAEGLFPLCGYLNHAADGSKKRQELTQEQREELERKEKAKSREILEKWSAMIYKEVGLLSNMIESDEKRFGGLK